MTSETNNNPIFFQDEGIVQRIDVFDLKIPPLTIYHIEYLTGKINNQALVSKVQDFEKLHDIEKQPYPIATQTQLQTLLSFIKNAKPGYFMARITTMFELLKDYRSFTVGQLEFRHSVHGKTKMTNTLKRIPALLSKTAILKRMTNSGHFLINKSEKKLKNNVLGINEMFQLSKKIESKNIAHHCQILRKRYPDLFNSDKYDEWSMNTSNTVKLILNFDTINQDKKDEMISKYLGAIYNIDRYVRYTTNNSESQMTTMGPYFTDSLYSYQIVKSKKMKMEINLSSQNGSKILDHSNLSQLSRRNDVKILDELKMLAKKTLNPFFTNRSIDTEKKELLIDHLHNSSHETVFIDEFDGKNNASQNISPFMIEETELNDLFSDPKINIDEIITDTTFLGPGHYHDFNQEPQLR